MLWLLELADSNPERVAGAAGDGEELAADAGRMVGAGRENVNRALAGLAAEGLVRLDGGRHVLADEPAFRERIARDWLIVERRACREAWGCDAVT